MIVIVSPSPVSGSLTAPSSKSSMQRACAAALITNGTTIIDNAGNSNDEQAAKKIVADLGAAVDDSGMQVIIQSSGDIFLPGYSDRNLISCGESGLSLRMFAPLAALFKYEITFTGEGSILTRPVDFFEDVFPQLDVTVQTNNGKIPLVLKGPLQPKNITVDGSLSSQFITGLLMAYAKACTGPVSIQVKNLSSKPYIDLTLDILRHFGFHVENENYEIFTVYPRAFDSSVKVQYTVEGDWSNVAFLLVAGAIAGNVTVNNIDLHSSQGDKSILNALDSCGASIQISGKEIHIQKNTLKAFDFDATHSPDLFPPLVALAAYCEGTTTIKGVSRLLHKESNRALTLQAEFAKMNVKIDLEGDLMNVHGGSQVTGAKVTSHNDHRIAMACAVAALNAMGATTIHEAGAVKKSYPSFYEDLKTLKASLQIL